MFDIEAAKVLKAGGRFTNADMEGFYEKAEQLGIEDTSFLDDYKTAEEMNLAVSKRKLEAIAQTQGFITPNDLEGLNPLVKDDPDVKGWLQDGTALAGQTSDQKEAFKKTVTRLTNDIYGLTSPDQVKGVQYDAVEQEVRNDLQSAYIANINNPKYSKDGVVDYGLALSDARAQVFQGAKIPRLKGHEDGKDYTNLVSTPAQRIQRGNAQYLERLQLNRDGLMSQGEKFITENKFSTDEEVQQGIDALNGKGNFPALYHDLARGQVNITPYDIAVGQAGAFGLEITPQPTEAATKQQKASVRRLLEYKPNIHKTERVFTPDMNAPEVVNKNLDRNTRAFVTTVRQLEGTTAGYDVVYGGKRVPGLTQMTLRELYDASKSGGTNRLPARLGGGRIPYHVDGYNSSASGALQLMPQTLLGLVRSGRYSWDTVFSPETQDRMMIDLARDRGVDVSKPLTVRDFNTLGWEWASMARHYGQTSRTPEQSHAIYTQNLRGTQ